MNEIMNTNEKISLEQEQEQLALLLKGQQERRVLFKGRSNNLRGWGLMAPIF